MVLAIMQPYFLPYLGYWQLLAAADRFVIYDDVQFIKGGWINRNRIKIGAQPAFISLHLDHSSPNRKICDIALVQSGDWKKRLLRTVEQNYASAPYFSETSALFRQIMEHPTPNLADFLLNQIRLVAKHLGVVTEIVETSRVYGNASLKGPERVIDICRRETASAYLNSAGGRDMYFPGPFKEAGIELRFYSMRQLEYAQGRGPFQPFLSLLDVLMWVGKVKAKDLLREINIVPA